MMQARAAEMCMRVARREGCLLTSQHCFTGFLVSFQAASTATMAQLLADTAAVAAVLVVVVLAVVLVALVVKLCQ
jgi:hypothetical protein